MLPGSADVVVVVVEPSAKAIDVAGRAARVAAARNARVVAIANRVRDDADLAAITAGPGGHEGVVVPEDPAGAAADRDGVGPTGGGGGSPPAPGLIRRAA